MSPEVPENGFGVPFWRVMGHPFRFSDEGLVWHVKRCVLSLLLGVKSNGLLLQNYANRTVHPSKIEDELSMVYVFRNVS